MNKIFVGRESEFTILSAARARALTGQGQLILIAGQPGSGKTRLLEEFARVAQPWATVLWGRCWEGEGAPAFWPWVQMIRAFVTDADPVALAEELGSTVDSETTSAARGPEGVYTYIDWHGT